MQIKHAKTSILPNSSNTSLVQPTDWNADHVVTDVVIGDVAGLQAELDSKADTTSVLPAVGELTLDLTGFVNRTDSEILFDTGTRTVTLQPTGGSYVVYHFGTRIEISTPKTIQISNTQGNRYINLDHNTLELYEVFGDPSFDGGQIPVAMIYWDVASQEALIFGEERHGTRRDTTWHQSTHYRQGVVWSSGGDLAYTLSDDSAVSISLSNPIVYFDEDIRLTATHSASPAAPFEQVLEGAAELPVIYHDGAGLSQTAPNALPWMHTVGNVPQYDQEVSPGMWALSEMTPNWYINYFLIATNDLVSPIKFALGHGQWETLADAAGEKFHASELDISELTLLYKIVLQYSPTYTGNPARLRIEEVAQGFKSRDDTLELATTSHAELRNRAAANQHPISAITNLQPELNARAPLVHTHAVTAIDAAGTVGQVLTRAGAGWEAADPYIPTPAEVGAVTETQVLPIVSAVMLDATGFPNRSDTAISFDAGTRTFTLTVVNSPATIYYRGNAITLTTNKTLVISDTSGGRYIAYDPNTNELYEAGINPSILDGVLFVAYINWNASLQLALLVGDERHSAGRDTYWHYSHHRDTGAVWRSGGALGFTLNDDAAVTLDISSPIVLADEDIEHIVLHSATPTAPLEQVLTPEALLTTLWIGTGGVYSVTDTPTTQPWLHSSNVAQYNQIVDGDGSLVNVPEGYYFNYWVGVTTDIYRPIKVLVGREIFDNSASAQDEELGTYGRPFPEAAPMHRITFQYSSAYTGNPARVRLIQVTRITESLSAGVSSTTPSSHGNLLGREAPDQHPVSSITNLQSTLDSKAPVVHTHALSAITQSGATLNQLIRWNGTNWAPFTQLPVRLLQVVSGAVPATSGTGQIPFGVSVPSITDGFLLWSQAVTPLSLTSKFLIVGDYSFAHSNNGRTVSFILWRDTTAIKANVGEARDSGGAKLYPMEISYMDPAGRANLNPITFSVRVGAEAGGTTYIGQSSTGANHGGLTAGQYIIMEIEA